MVSITDFSDEVLNIILCYLPSLDDIWQFALTCKWANWYIFGSDDSADPLFRAVYYETFGVKAIAAMSARQQFKNALELKQRTRNFNSSLIERIRQRVLATIQVLPHEEEAEAVLYDNPDHQHAHSPNNPHDLLCLGYFGCRPLLESRFNSPVAIWGDFAGLRIAPSMDALVNPTSRYRDCLVAIHDDGKGTGNYTGKNNHRAQVMAVLMVPSSVHAMAKKKHTFFLGFASGTVMAILATATTTPTKKKAKTINKNVDYDEYTYRKISSCNVHANEVTCMAHVPNYYVSDDDDKTSFGCLVSACVKGYIYLYPDSVTHSSLKKHILIHNPNKSSLVAPVFAMAATSFENHIVLCFGGKDLRMAVWCHGNRKPQPNKAMYKEKEPSLMGTFELNECANYEQRLAEEEEEDDDGIESHTTHLNFVGVVRNKQHYSRYQMKKENKHELLVIGTSKGNIFIWDLLTGPCCNCIHSSGNLPFSNPVLEERSAYNPHPLTLRCSERGVHSGGVESTERVGNVLFTMGGKDGVLKVFDLSSNALLLATIPVHPGRIIPLNLNIPAPVLKCSVVRTMICHDRGSIVTLCRDGHISEWIFNGTEPEKQKGKKKIKGIKRGDGKRRRVSPRCSSTSRR